MHTNSAIRFRDPFVSEASSLASLPSNVTYDRSRASQRPRQFYPGLARPLTPPPDMNAVQPTSHYPSCFPQEHGYHFGEQMAAQPAGQIAYGPSNVQYDFGLHAASNSLSSRSSPIRSSYTDDDCSGRYGSHRRRASYASIPAADYQVPTNVNYSGEGIHELAAQITCLFWFESSEVLQQIEDSKSTPFAIHRPLIQDARPTREFRDWVAHVLSTTRVADNVIILALLFIYRLKKQNTTVRGKPGSEYRLLTIALMLGNKFLDDNTYTNKTWAEVSRINVDDVHIMEVEFLSNMKYCLFTSEQDWQEWRTLLGKFVTFYGQATRPQQPATILPSGPLLQLPRALPSPPASIHASPPYASVDVPFAAAAPVVSLRSQHGPTPAPSPLPVHGDGGNVAVPRAPRKRSLDESASEPAAKRLSTNYQKFTSPQKHHNSASHYNHVQPAPRLTLPNPKIPSASCQQIAPPQQLLPQQLLPQQLLPQQLPPQQLPPQQLPPLSNPASVPARAMAMVFNGGNGNNAGPVALPVSTSMPSQIPTAPSTQYPSRHTSPRGAQSNVPSPTASIPSTSTALYPGSQVSPSYFLQQRSSPYRPVHRVSTLLYPPPSAAIQAQSRDIELNQMQYQPLGKPVQHTGRLPYLAQNQWVVGAHPQEMTPVHRWPGFNYAQPSRKVSQYS